MGQVLEPIKVSPDGEVELFLGLRERLTAEVAGCEVKVFVPGRAFGVVFPFADLVYGVGEQQGEPLGTQVCPVVYGVVYFGGGEHPPRAGIGRGFVDFDSEAYDFFFRQGYLFHGGYPLLMS